MNCQEIEAKLAETVAGERDADPEVEAHLLACESCRKDFSLARAGWEAAEGWPEPKLPAGLAVRVCRKIGASPRGYVLRIGTGVAAAAALFLLVVNILPKEAERPAGQKIVWLSGRDTTVLLPVRKDVRVEIVDGIATTTVEQAYHNPTRRPVGGTFVHPVPPEASVSHMALEVNGKFVGGRIGERGRVSPDLRDTPVTEGEFFRCDIPAVAPASERRVRLTYTEPMPVQRGWLRYRYPLAVQRAVPDVTCEVTVRFRAGIESAPRSSPPLAWTRKGDREWRGRFRAERGPPKGDLWIEVKTPGKDDYVSAFHKPEGEDGYFLVSVTSPGRTKPRNVALLLDTSASVGRTEWEASREVVRAIVGSLGPRDSLVVLANDAFVRRFSGARSGVDPWLEGIEPGGGHDLGAGLRAAAGERPDEIIFVGEGRPTLGERDADKMSIAFQGTFRAVVVEEGPADSSLVRLAGKYRGKVYRIRAGDAVRERAAEIVRAIWNEATIVVASSNVYDLTPVNFAGGRNLRVAGRIRGESGTLQVAGKAVSVSAPKTPQENRSVKQLWAQQKISHLLVEGKANRKQVVTLSFENGVLTPYTCFKTVGGDAGVTWGADPLVDRLGRYWYVSALPAQRRGGTGSTAGSYYARGVLRVRLGDATGAWADFDRALKLDPGRNRSAALAKTWEAYRDAISIPRGEIEAIVKSVAVPPLTATVVGVEVDSERITLSAGKAAGVAKGMLFAITRDAKFVAVVVVTEVREKDSIAAIWEGVEVAKVLPGDQATRVEDPEAMVRLLPDPVRKNVASLSNARRVRRNLEMERAMRTR